MIALLGHSTVTMIELAPGHIENLVSCYRQVYGEASAWREFKICPECGRQWSIQEWAQHLIERHLAGEYVEHCTCGNGNVKDYWPADKVRAKILSEAIGRDAGISLALFDGSKLIGFIWGYGTTIDQLEQEQDMPDLAAAVRKHFGSNAEEVFYQSEMGVLKPYRQKGFGKALLWHRLCLAVETGHKVGLVRVNPKAKSHHMWLKYGFEPIPGYELPGAKGDVNRVVLRGSLFQAKQLFAGCEPDIVRDISL